MARKKGFRFKIFWKILFSCLALAGLMIGLSFAYTKYRLSQQGRGRFLESYFKRYQRFQAGMGEAVGSVTDIIAEDGGLRGRLSPPTEAQNAGNAVLTGAPPLTPEERKARAVERATEMYDTLSGPNAVRPELFVLFDVAGTPIFLPDGSPVKPADLREMEAVAKVRGGQAFFNKLLVHNRHVYVVAGVPIKRRGKDQTEIVGGVIIGVGLERYFGEYKSASDDVEKEQLRLVLVKGSSDIIAATFPDEKLDQLGAALRPEKHLKVDDGPDTIEIVEFDDQTWDFYGETVSGFMGSETGTIGTLYIMKTRAGMKQPEGQGFAALSGIALALIVAFILALWLTRPLNLFIEATSQISQGSGDLTKRIEVNSNDELGDLAENLNRVFDNLHHLATDVQSASFQVGASSAEISAASKQMLEGAKEQAVKIESSTTAATELSTSIQQVAHNATETTKFAKQSNEQMGAAIKSINQIRTTVEDAAEKVRELGESGKRIGNIVEVIRQISEQTSLLALNASIEAAHAGEQGRGFAVVADEVSSLAKRVGQSAKDIEDLIATIKDQTSDAVSTMQTGTREVESGTQLVTSTLGDLKRIIDVISDTATAVQEQAVVSDEIARNMDAVQKIANEVLASSEEAVIQGEQLHTLAYHLEESVRGFNLDGKAKDKSSAAPPEKTLAEPANRPPEDGSRTLSAKNKPAGKADKNA